MASPRNIYVQRFEGGLTLNVEVGVSELSKVDKGRMVTISMPEGGGIALTPADAARLGKALQHLVDLPFVQSLED